ncbi:chitinase domain-containing protein 1 [Macadamia integrifolia]|uniref:chitinase domain-containing protein 1 n=1 Tax=Macadamia integrifolia TaxID=60698 RepID=UPI001C4EC073|nr:chitinase domain-containing protein 1 [Macadamia integrifolia]
MGRRRDRRVQVDPNRDRQQSESVALEDRRSSGVFSDRRLIVIFFSSVVLLPIFSLIVYRIKEAPQAADKLLSVYDRSLVNPNVNYQEILAEHSKVLENTSHRHYTYPVLAYITPWNSRGYELAKRFISKITHVSPVWYDLKSEGTKLVLDGRHNADKGWISDLRMNGHALVLPRVVLEAFPKEFLRKKKQKDKAIDLIVRECRDMGYDGIVLESWSRWAAYGVLHDPDLRTQALQFIKQLGDALHAVNSERNPEHYLQLVYVIGPPHLRNLQSHDFGPEDLQALSSAVDGFSLMTYDFSGPQNPGPNAPLKWMQSTLQLLLHSTRSDPSMARKMLLGINFYGNDFMLSEGSGGGAITSKEYLSLLEKHKPVLQWEENSAEHLFVYFDNKRVKHAVFYPSLMSISKRLEEARTWGVGISIWEIGQGLDYFFDLL